MDIKLATKIYNVMCAIEGVEKGVTVGKGTKGEYKAVGEKDVLNVIKPLLKQEKLICLPYDGTITDYVNITEAYDKKSTRAITQIKVFFRLVDIETGEETQIVGFGNGADSQDKGSGKAFTYAYKTALQKSFCMFSGEDTDNTHSDDIGTQSTADNSKVTVGMLQEIIKKVGKTDDDYIKWYNERTETKKEISDLKFMPQETKQHLYSVLIKKVGK